MVLVMDVQARYVAVDAKALDDVLELSARACDQLQRLSANDPLPSALRGSIAQVRTSSVLEPE